MSDVQLSLDSWAENQAKVAGGIKLDPDHGTFTLSANTVKGALDVTRAAFGLLALDQQYATHLNWLVGDLLWNGGDRFHDDFIQEFDTMASVVGWNRTRLTQREATSRLYSDARLRRYSYDRQQWAELFPAMVAEGIEGVNSPLMWAHYREAGLVRDVHLHDVMKVIQIAYFCRFNSRETRALLTQAKGVHDAGDLSGFLDDLVTSSAQDTQMAMEKIEFLEGAYKEHSPKGRYILIGAGKENEIVVSRVRELSPVRYEEAAMVLKFGGRDGLAEVVSYDGISEELEPIHGEV